MNIQLATTPASIATSYLQRVLEELVHLGDLGGDGKVDGAVTDLNDKATTDVRVDLQNIVSTFRPQYIPLDVLVHSQTYLRHNLELLALANVLALANSGLQLPDNLGVQSAGGGDGHLNLATGGAHEGTELLGDALEDGEAVVLGEGVEELLQGVVGDAGGLLELGDDLLLVLDGEGGRGEDLLQLSVLLEGALEVLHGARDGLERGGLGGRGVLCARTACQYPVSFYSPG